MITAKLTTATGDQVKVAKQPKQPKQPWKSRKKTCCQCKKSLLFYSVFRPRWRGCRDHKQKGGRFVHAEGCLECARILIDGQRQPRCIKCDRKRLAKVREEGREKRREVARIGKVARVGKVAKVARVAKRHRKAS
jgi:hypothetical protein